MAAPRGNLDWVLARMLNELYPKIICTYVAKHLSACYLTVLHSPPLDSFLIPYSCLGGKKRAIENKWNSSLGHHQFQSRWHRAIFSRQRIHRVDFSGNPYHPVNVVGFQHESNECDITTGSTIERFSSGRDSPVQVTRVENSPQIDPKFNYFPYSPWNSFPLSIY